MDDKFARTGLTTVKSDNFYLKCRAFCDAIRENGPSPIPWQEIIYNQAIIDGIIRSSELKREVDVVIPADLGL